MIFTRRLIMIASGAAFALRALGARGPGTPAEAATRLRALVGDPGSARVVGRAYFAAHPAEATPERVARELVRSLGLEDGSLVAEDDASLRSRMARQIRADFAQGKIVSVGGWVLARTEARLCGLWA